VTYPLDERDRADQATAAQWRARLDASLGGHQSPQLVELERLNRSGVYPLPMDDAGSPWVGCDSVHPACR
jgi:hypothetical protein